MDQQDWQGELEREIEHFNTAGANIQRLARNLDHHTLTQICYAHFARAYDQHMEATGHFRALRQALDTVKEYIQGPLLDVSCGTGEALHYLREHIEENNLAVTANDFSPKMLEIAKKKLTGLDLVEFSTEDLSRIPIIGMEGAKKKFAGKDPAEIFSLELQTGPLCQYQTVLCSYSVHGFRNPNIFSTILNSVKRFGYFIALEEWPCLVSLSPYLPAAMAELLPLTEEPLEVVLGTGTMDTFIAHEGSFAKIAPKDKPSLGSLMTERGMTHVGVGCFAIDARHKLYAQVYEKLSDPGII